MEPDGRGGFRRTGPEPDSNDESPEESDTFANAAVAIGAFDHAVANSQVQRHFKTIQHIGELCDRLQREFDGIDATFKMLRKEINELKRDGEFHRLKMMQTFEKLEKDLEDRFKLVESRRKEDVDKFHKLQQKVDTMERTLESRTTKITEEQHALAMQFQNMTAARFPSSQTIVNKSKYR